MESPTNSDLKRLQRGSSTTSSCNYSNTSTIILPKWEWNANKLLNLEQLRIRDPPSNQDEDRKCNFFEESLKYGQQIQRSMWDIDEVFKDRIQRKLDQLFDPPEKVNKGEDVINADATSQDIQECQEEAIKLLDYTLENELLDSSDDEVEDDDVTITDDTISNYLMLEGFQHSRRGSIESVYCVF